MGNYISLVGRQFGRLHVVGESGYNNQGKIMWACLCECGKMKRVYGNSLLRGATRSCGCYKREKAIETLNKYGRGRKHEDVDKQSGGQNEAGIN